MSFYKVKEMERVKKLQTLFSKKTTFPGEIVCKIKQEQNT